MGWVGAGCSAGRSVGPQQLTLQLSKWGPTKSAADSAPARSAMLFTTAWSTGPGLSAPWDPYTSRPHAWVVAHRENRREQPPSTAVTAATTGSSHDRDPRDGVVEDRDVVEVVEDRVMHPELRANR